MENTKCILIKEANFQPETTVIGHQYLESPEIIGNKVKQASRQALLRSTLAVLDYCMTAGCPFLPECNPRATTVDTNIGVAPAVDSSLVFENDGTIFRPRSA